MSQFIGPYFRRENILLIFLFFIPIFLLTNSSNFCLIQSLHKMFAYFFPIVITTYQILFFIYNQSYFFETACVYLFVANILCKLRLFFSFTPLYLSFSLIGSRDILNIADS